MRQSNLTPMQIVKSLQFDINYKTERVNQLKEVIKNGNFEGYSSALEARKSRLKSYEKDLIDLNLKLEQAQAKAGEKIKFEVGVT